MVTTGMTSVYNKKQNKKKSLRRPFACPESRFSAYRVVFLVPTPLGTLFSLLDWRVSSPTPGCETGSFQDEQKSNNKVNKNTYEVFFALIVTMSQSPLLAIGPRSH